tara:strand:- start:576 stop:782 length:207 start_codon:yes stop_codon:yes gene_type:complete
MSSIPLEAAFWKPSCQSLGWSAKAKLEKKVDNNKYPIFDNLFILIFIYVLSDLTNSINATINDHYKQN